MMPVDELAQAIKRKCTKLYPPIEVIFGSDRSLPNTLIVGRKADDRCVLIRLKSPFYDLRYYKTRSTKVLESETCNCSYDQAIALSLNFLRNTSAGKPRA